MSSPHVIDVTTANFQETVEQSATQPVLLDFWADWCGPCKTLGPVLEAMAEEYAGGFVLGKVNTETEQELAAAFRVQGIPFCVLLAGGRPVDAFTGVLPAEEIRAFLERGGVSPKEAAAPAEDEDTPEGAMRRALTAAAAGDAAAAREALGGVEDEHELASDRDRVRDALAWFDGDLAGDSPAAAPLATAQQAFLAGQMEPAMESILESLQADASYGGQIARKAMVLCFLIVGEDSDLCSDFRRRMATLLY